MYKKLLSISLIVTLFGFGELLASNNQTLHLKSGTYELQPNISSISKQDLASSLFDCRYFVLIHFNDIPTNSRKSELKNIVEFEQVCGMKNKRKFMLS